MDFDEHDRHTRIDLFSYDDRMYLEEPKIHKGCLQVWHMKVGLHIFDQVPFYHLKAARWYCNVMFVLLYIAI